MSRTRSPQPVVHSGPLCAEMGLMRLGARVCATLVLSSGCFSEAADVSQSTAEDTSASSGATTSDGPTGGPSSATLDGTGSTTAGGSTGAATTGSDVDTGSADTGMMPTGCAGVDEAFLCEDFDQPDRWMQVWNVSDTSGMVELFQGNAVSEPNAMRTELTAPSNEMVRSANIVQEVDAAAGETILVLRTMVRLSGSCTNVADGDARQVMGLSFSDGNTIPYRVYLQVGPGNDFLVMERHGVANQPNVLQVPGPVPVDTWTQLVLRVTLDGGVTVVVGDASAQSGRLTQVPDAPGSPSVVVGQHQPSDSTAGACRMDFDDVVLAPPM